MRRIKGLDLIGLGSRSSLIMSTYFFNSLNPATGNGSTGIPLLHICQARSSRLYKHSKQSGRICQLAGVHQKYSFRLKETSPFSPELNLLHLFNLINLAQSCGREIARVVTKSAFVRVQNSVDQTTVFSQMHAPGPQGRSHANYAKPLHALRSMRRSNS